MPIFVAGLFSAFGIFSLFSTSLVVQADAINSTDFVITVKTDNLSEGSSADNQFTIPTTNVGYNYTVDCNNDGTHEVVGQTGNYTCDYATPGTYTIRIAGTFPQIYFNDTGDKLKLTEINQWGTNAWTSMQNAFYGAANMELYATDTPNLSSATALTQMFRGATSLTGASGNWDWALSGVITTGSMFYAASSFNGDISSWDTSTVTSFASMFNGAISFNQPIGNWNTANVLYMNSMFYAAQSFNQYVGSWLTSNVLNMQSIFRDAKAFNNGEASGSHDSPLNWDTGKVTNMATAFHGAQLFNQSVSGWDTKNVTNMVGMFFSAPEFNNGEVAGSSTAPLNWDTSKVTSMQNMFRSALSFNQSVGDWNTASVNTMYAMFYEAPLFNNGEAAGSSTAPLNWDTGNVIDMYAMFFGNRSFNQSVGEWDISKVINTSYMFYNASVFNQSVSLWDTALVKDFSHMFRFASSFNNGQEAGSSMAPIEWDTSSATNMSGMFFGSSSFNQPIGTWSTSAVTSMSYMFNQAFSFNQPIGNWDTSNVTDMSYMLRLLPSFNQPLDTWDTSKVINMYAMFNGSTAFNQSLGDWDTTAVTSMAAMFLGATSFDQPLSSWNVTSLSNAINMFTYVKLSTENYDQTLKSWSAQTLQPGVTFHGGSSTYCLAETARADMAADDGWIITDGGSNCTAYQVTYDGNGSTGGIPIATGHPASPDFTVTISDQATLEKTGYSLASWNTQADGSGLSYTPGSTYVFSSPDTPNLNLYAQWIDSTAPVTPQNAPTLTPSSDSGSSNTDNITNINTPTLNLYCTETGSELTISITNATTNTTITNTITCNTIGPVSLTLSPALTDGTYNVTYTETDATGNESEASPALNLTIDTEAPAAPTITQDPITEDNTINLAESNDAITVTGNITGANTNETVILTVNGIAYTGTINADGNYAIDIPGFDLASDPDTTLTISITTYDTAGNETTSTTDHSYNVDTNIPTDPSRPTIPEEQNTGSSPTDIMTNLTNIDLEVYCDPNSLDSTNNDTITIYLNASEYTTANCQDADPTTGLLTITMGPLQQGNHNITYTRTTTTGNTSPRSAPLNLTIDTEAPAITTDTTESTESSPELTGTTDDNNATITVTIDNQTYTATNIQDGTWTLPQGTIARLTSGEYTITVTATDQAGNQTIQEVTLTIELPVTPEPEVPQEPTEPGQIEEDEPEKPQDGEALSETGLNLWLTAFIGAFLVMAGLSWRVGLRR